MKKNSYILLNIASLIVTCTALIYIIKLVGAYSREMAASISLLFSNEIVLPLLLSLLGGVVSALVWHFVALRHGATTTWQRSYWAWSLSRLYRYLPGKIFGVAARIRAHGVINQKILTASFSEVLVSYLPILYLAILTFPFLITDKWLMSALVLVLLILTIFMLFSRKFVEWGANYAPASMRGRMAYIAVHLMHPKDLTFYSALTIPAILLHGSGFYFLGLYIAPAIPLDFFGIVLSLYVSGLVGQFAILVPAGIGVREATLTLLLIQQGMPEIEAALLALANRVVLLASEGVNVVLSGGYIYVKGRVN